MSDGSISTSGTTESAMEAELEHVRQEVAQLGMVEEVQSSTVVSAEAIQLGIDAWVDQYIRGSIIAQNTQVWNHLMQSLPGLRAAIVKGL